MTLHRFPTTLAVSALLILTSACAADSEPPEQEEAKPANLVRTPSCLELQDSICDFMADQCSQQTREQCDKEVGSLFCNPDVVQACLDALPSATCPHLPDVCKGFYDEAPAKWYCEELVDRQCSRQAACKLEAKADCLAHAADILDCSQAVGAQPYIEECLDAIDRFPCGAEAGMMPTVCVGAILFLDPTEDPPQDG